MVGEALLEPVADPMGDVVGRPHFEVEARAVDDGSGAVDFPDLLEGYHSPSAPGDFCPLDAESVVVVEGAETSGIDVALDVRSIISGTVAVYDAGEPGYRGELNEHCVTMAEVLSEAGYTTGFFGKSHLGDVESSYMNRQGFDEALWAPYNQVPSLYVPQAQIAVLSGAVMFPEMFPEDPYDIDKGWRPKGYIWALEGNKGGPVREVGEPPNHDEYMRLMDEFFNRTMQFVRDNADGDKPVFILRVCIMGQYKTFDHPEVSQCHKQETL